MYAWHNYYSLSVRPWGVNPRTRSTKCTCVSTHFHRCVADFPTNSCLAQLLLTKCKSVGVNPRTRDTKCYYAAVAIMPNSGVLLPLIPQCPSRHWAPRPSQACPFYDATTRHTGWCFSSPYPAVLPYVAPARYVYRQATYLLRCRCYTPDPQLCVRKEQATHHRRIVMGRTRAIRAVSHSEYLRGFRFT